MLRSRQGPSEDETQNDVNSLFGESNGSDDDDPFNPSTQSRSQPKPKVKQSQDIRQPRLPEPAHVLSRKASSSQSRPRTLKDVASETAPRADLAGCQTTNLKRAHDSSQAADSHSRKLSKVSNTSDFKSEVSDMVERIDNGEAATPTAGTDELDPLETRGAGQGLDQDVSEALQGHSRVRSLDTLQAVDHEINEPLSPNDTSAEMPAGSKLSQDNDAQVQAYLDKAVPEHEFLLRIPLPSLFQDAETARAEIDILFSLEHNLRSHASFRTSTYLTTLKRHRRVLEDAETAGMIPQVPKHSPPGHKNINIRQNLHSMLDHIMMSSDSKSLRRLSVNIDGSRRKSLSMLENLKKAKKKKKKEAAAAAEGNHHGRESGGRGKFDEGEEEELRVVDLAEKFMAALLTLTEDCAAQLDCEQGQVDEGK